MRSSLRARWSALPRVTKICGAVGAPLLCAIVWMDVALARRPSRRVDEGVPQALVTMFLGPTAILFVIAALVGMRRARAARVIAYCGVVWPVVMEVAWFAAFAVY